MASTRRGGGGGAAIAAAAEELRAMANGGHHKTVMITRVGRGLGRALAIEMARRGHTVFGFSRDFYDLESLGLILYSDPDHRRVLFHLNVRDDEAISLFAHNAIGLVGAPDIIGQRSSNLISISLILRVFTPILVCFSVIRSELLLFSTVDNTIDENVNNPLQSLCVCLLEVMPMLELQLHLMCSINQSGENVLSIVFLRAIDEDLMLEANDTMAKLDVRTKVLMLATYDLAELQIEGDGNCQFRALADQLFRNPEHHNCLCCGHITYMALRIAIYAGVVTVEGITYH
ncbi:hypothetical protein Syun_000788 [Stephania yunnanensis]|uniref:OTU domain-containing protein n=1 Tax=Stephania yunnanensis TaxID=152371 RepID=A0AAP0LDR4_9MAGN